MSPWTVVRAAWHGRGVYGWQDWTDRVDRREMPHTPCPLVQPLPRRVPKPTIKPATAVSHSGATGALGNSSGRMSHMMKPADRRPATNDRRKPRSLVGRMTAPA